MSKKALKHLAKKTAQNHRMTAKDAPANSVVISSSWGIRLKDEDFLNATKLRMALEAHRETVTKAIFMQISQICRAADQYTGAEAPADLPEVATEF